LTKCRFKLKVQELGLVKMCSWEPAVEGLGRCALPQNREGLPTGGISKFVRRLRRELSPAASLLVVIVLCVAGRLPGQANESSAQDSGSRSKESAVTANQSSESKENTDQETQASPRRGPIHIVPYGPPAKPPGTRPQASGALSNQGRVQYWGGPVISNVNVIEVLWGNFVDGPSTTGLDQFFNDITSSNYFGLLAEYSTVGLTGFGAGSPPGSNQTIGPGVFGGKFTISPSVCPGGGTPCTITDTQIQNELVSQVNSLALPQPVQDPQGNFNTLYMIYFPPNVTINVAPGVNSCQQGGFCAYHSNVLVGNKLPYGVLPDFSPAGGCVAPHCGSGTSFQNLTAASSHELSEAVTDVDVGTANAFAPPLAWADQVTGEEIGDFCAHNNTQVIANGNTYTVQNEWSNMQNGCVATPAHFLVQPATANAVPGSPFQITVTAQATLGFQLFAYNDTVHFTSSDPAAALPADYTFVPKDNGSHTFTVTLNTTTSQTITANDTIITAMTGAGTVDVEHNPDLIVASAHMGSFTQSQIGATYTLTVSNVGDRPTNGTTVIVTDNLPFGLTAQAISGTGWNCTLASLTCTRSDFLGNGLPYPAITLTVNVQSFAPPTIINSVTVSGGGELNTSNDTGTDPTTVIQLPDLTIFKNHTGVFTEGEIGETYLLTVFNAGFAPTSGTVTVVDTLPSGLTATAITGTGWSCTLSSLTCMRSDVLANGSSYSAITVTVNVAASGLPNSITNSALVSGGGEANTANDTANDVTFIAPPASDLVIASTHTGDFTQGQTGATYTLTVSNIGPLPTTGTVTVNDNLPFVFTPRSMTGSGWTCNLSTPPSCTRNDPLAGNTGSGAGSYPPITLAVDVSPTAFTPQTNFAFVSGGGEANTANDSASDPTNVIQLADLTIGQSTSVLAQGLTGANYMLTVANIGQGPTSGMVTVTDTLAVSLTATAMSGSGWNCTLGTLTCTRSDVLAANSGYPTITLTVNVAANAPSSVVNTATVAGGGEIITTNDTSTVTSQVLPPVAVSVFFSNGTVTAGAAATYELLLNAPVPGQITTACTAGVPPGAACLIGSTPLTAPFNGSVLVTVTTTAPRLAQRLPESRMLPVYALLMPFLGAVILRRGRSKRSLSAALRGLALLFLLAGCGGGSSGPPPPVATPPGTYTITVTVTNTTTNTQATAPLTLIVK
jgi:uncharacterized repeat protein (TIGR01451 family)